MDLSIVITTYDRVELVKLVLEDLSVQRGTNADRYEIIVVDNAGDPLCAQLAANFDVRYFHEEKVGHCHARNRGLAEASAPWVLYFDDDVRLPKTIITEFMQFLPQVTGAAFGGRFHHWYLSPAPAWLKLQHGKGSRPGTSEHFGMLPHDQYLIGCFFAVRKDITLSLGGFNPEFGMQGKEVGWADETDIQMRMRQNGHEVFYAPELVIKHLKQPWKCSIKGELLHAYSHGKLNWDTLTSGKRTNASLTFVLDLLRITFIVIPTTVLRWIFRQRQWYWQNAFLVVATKYAFSLGVIAKNWKVKQAN